MRPKRAIHILFNFTRGMSYPTVLFVAQLESFETRRNNLSRSFFKIFANQPTVFIISFHLPEIPPFPPSHHFLAKTQFTHEKVLFIYKLWPTPLPTNTRLLTHSTHLSQHLCTYMHIVCFVCCFFIYYFNCISFAARLSGHKFAIKLID